jgi:hypothetical protein
MSIGSSNANSDGDGVVFSGEVAVERGPHFNGSLKIEPPRITRLLLPNSPVKISRALPSVSAPS